MGLGRDDSATKEGKRKVISAHLRPSTTPITAAAANDGGGLHKTINFWITYVEKKVYYRRKH